MAAKKRSQRGRPVRPRGRTSLCSRSIPAGAGLVFIMMCLVAFGFTSQAEANSPAHEVRAFWVLPDVMDDPAGIDQVFSTADAYGFNVLFLQVNVAGEVYYESDILPRAPGVPAGFDPLAYALQLGEATGIQVHAWISLLGMGPLGTQPEAADHPLVRRPDWVTVDGTGRSLWDYSPRETTLDLPRLMLDPGLAEVRNFAVDVAMEVVQRYSIDGVHLDLLRYPSSDFGYHPQNRRDFETETGYDPLELRASPWEYRNRLGDAEYERVLDLWHGWRKSRVTNLVERIYGAVTAAKPWLPVSAAVYPDLQDARNERLQDWPAWLEAGIVDAVVLKAYSPNTLVVTYQMEDAVEVSANRHIYAGLGAYLLTDNVASLVEKVTQVRQAGTHGTVMFSYNRLAAEAALLASLREDAFAEQAAVPTMGWKAEAPMPEEEDAP